MISFQKEPAIKRFVKVDIFFQNPKIRKVEIYWELYAKNHAYETCDHEISQINAKYRYVDESPKILFLIKRVLACQSM